MPGSLKSSNCSKSIIDKYNLSRSHINLSAHFDQEEAQNNYSLLDYFGFYHPDGLTHRDKEVEHKYRKKDVKRVDKWLKFIQSNGFDSFYKGRPNEELIRRVFKGIPPPIRPRVWPILLNVAKVKRDRIYEDMRKHAFVSSTYIEQIDLDINRTFRSSTFFNESFGPRQQVLFRILAAYSMYNTEIGYCQGMSDIAGMLLIYIMDEEDAFWALVQLLDGSLHKMHCLFVRDFPGLRRYFAHHDRLLHTHLRKVWKHFRREHIDCCTYAFKWYMQCFLGRLPISLTLRIWDIYLLEGEKALVAMAYNILKMHKQRLLRMDQMQVLTFLQDEIARDFGFDDDDVIDSLKDCFEELRHTNMDTPPPLAADMLPTKTMGQSPDVWEVRHSEDEDNAEVHQQKQPARYSRTKQTDPVTLAPDACAVETDGVVRCDETLKPNATIAAAPMITASAMRKPLPRVKVPTPGKERRQQSSPLDLRGSPLSTDSRRRLKGSQQSVNSFNSVVTSTRVSSGNNASSASHRRFHQSLPKPNAQPLKSHTKISPLIHPQSQRFPNNDTLAGKMEGNGRAKEEEEEENVWFIPSGISYNSPTTQSEVRQRKAKELQVQRKSANADLPPRDYKVPNGSRSVMSEDDDLNLPWLRDKPPPQSLGGKVVKTANTKTSKTSISMFEWPSSTERSLPPAVCTKLDNADTYGTLVQGPGTNYAFLRHSNRRRKNSGDTRWSVYGTVCVLPSPPRACSTLYPPPQR